MMIRDMRGDELFVCGEGLILMLDARGAGVTWKSCGDGVVVVGCRFFVLDGRGRREVQV